MADFRAGAEKKCKMLLEHLTVSGSREEFRRDGVRLMGPGSQPGAAKKVKEKQNSGIFSKVFAPKHLLLTKGK